MTHSRREVLAAAAGTVFASVLLPLRATAIPQLRVTGIELLPYAKQLASITCASTTGRHTALTRLAEKGQPDWVIQAQMGHVSPAMMRTYSHIRRKALDEAVAALEPSFKLVFPPDPRGLKPACERIWLLGLDSH